MLSSSEAKYVAANAVAQENAYLLALLSGFDRSPLGPTCVWEDNAACILMSENPSITIAAVTLILNFSSSASEYVLAKSSYTSVGVPSMSLTP